MNADVVSGQILPVVFRCVLNEMQVDDPQVIDDAEGHHDRGDTGDDLRQAIKTAPAIDNNEQQREVHRPFDKLDQTVVRTAEIQMRQMRYRNGDHHADQTQRDRLSFQRGRLELLDHSLPRQSERRQDQHFVNRQTRQTADQFSRAQDHRRCHQTEQHEGQSRTRRVHSTIQRDNREQSAPPAHRGAQEEPH